jgi:hypothetical protein
MDIAGTFLFEVVFRDIPVLGENRDSPTGDQSVIVEVESDGILKTATDADSPPHSRNDGLCGP